MLYTVLHGITIIIAQKVTGHSLKIIILDTNRLNIGTLTKCSNSGGSNNN